MEYIHKLAAKLSFGTASLLATASIAVASAGPAFEPWLVQRFSDNHLFPEYQIAEGYEPVVLRSDLDGDGKADCAVLVKRADTGALGIAIFHRASSKMIMVAAGNDSEGVGADMRWLTSWRIISAKERPTVDRGGIFLVKEGSASGELWWDGEKYRWTQVGD